MLLFVGPITGTIVANLPASATLAGGCLGDRSQIAKFEGLLGRWQISKELAPGFPRRWVRFTADPFVYACFPDSAQLAPGWLLNEGLL